MNKYHHLTLEEREKLFVWHEKKVGVREIGRRLNRNPGTISRELKRNATGKGKNSREYLIFRYVACRAQIKSEKKALKQRTKCPLKNPAIFLYVREHLRKPHYWTPEEIAGRLSIDHPEYSIHHETIYRYIYGKKQKRMKLWLHLRLHRKKRMKWHGRKIKGNLRLKNVLPIEQRPEEANTRKQEGHWETDNVGTIKTDKTGVSATVERKTRIIRLRKLKDGKAMTKRRTLVAQVKKEGSIFQRSMTIDRGPENSDHEGFTRRTGINVYACNAYHSWEKGSVENSIGRARFFIPKGESVDQLKQKDLNRIEKIMNNTPRKIIAYLTPNEVYERILKDSNTT